LFTKKNDIVYETIFLTGGGVSVDIDDEGLETYVDVFDDVATSSHLEERITDSDIVRDSSGKCNVIAQLASTGKYM